MAGRATLSLPKVLLGAYAVLFAVLAIAPYDRTVWYAEIIPMVLLVAIIIAVSRHHAFSATSYILMSFLILLHTIGAHYTFERVPFGLVTETFDFTRNHFDRVGHFTVGFYAYPIAELLRAKRWVRSRAILILFPVFTILAVAALYEMFEWLYAVYAEPSAGDAVLGSQGDRWDAQKDMLADSLGAVFAIGLFWIMHRGRTASA